jgi:flagellar biosynthesis/type III secretory pathway protein FliH
VVLKKKKKMSVSKVSAHRLAKKRVKKGVGVKRVLRIKKSPLRKKNYSKSSIHRNSGLNRKLYNEGYDQGFDESYNEGFNVGYAQGSSQN